MKEKSLFHRVLCVMALCFFLLLPSASVQGQTSQTLFLQLEKYEDVLKQLDGQTSNHQLTVWSLDSKYDIVDRGEIVRTLHALKEEQLNQRFPCSQFNLTFLPDYIEVNQIPDGVHYARLNLQTDQVQYRSEFVFKVDHTSKERLVILAKKIEVTTQVQLIKTDEIGKRLAGVSFRLYSVADDGTTTSVPLTDTYRYRSTGQIDSLLTTDKDGELWVSDLPQGHYRFVEVQALEGYDGENVSVDVTVSGTDIVTVTVVNKKLKMGNHQFIKIDGSSRKPLANAVFKVTQLQNNQYVPVRQADKEIVLTSDAEGRFIVENLAYGTYYLWEIKAPTGYVQLARPLEFTIDGSDTPIIATVISNNKRPAIDIPNTGDITLYVLMVCAFVLFVVGYRLYRESQ